MRKLNPRNFKRENIIDIKADAIVISTNEVMSNPHGVHGAVLNAGGVAYKQNISQGMCDLGSTSKYFFLNSFLCFISGFFK